MSPSWFRRASPDAGDAAPFSSAVSEQLQNVLGANDDAEVQDLVCTLLLSEAIYKAAEGPPPAATAALNDLRSAFPAGRGLCPIEAVQFSRRAAGHRFLLARSPNTLYAAFLGTKHPADLLADAAFLTRLLWSGEGAAAASSGAGRSGSSSGAASASAPAAAAAAAAAAAGDAAAAAAPAPAAHRGFLGRAQAVPAEALYAHARCQGLRFVLCGHSLGGAVAQLCTLRLLAALPAPPPPADLRCLVFGAPAVGNSALAEHVRERGWARFFTSVALPEDPIPRLLLLQAAGAEAAAAVSAGPPPQAAGAAVAAAGLAQPPAEAAAGSESAAAAEVEPEGADLQADDSQADAADAAPGSIPASSWPAAAIAWRAAGVARSAAGLAQRPLKAAAGAAVSAARAGANLVPPLLPSFSLLGGRQLLLLPDAMLDANAPAAAAVAAAASADPLASATASAEPQQARRPLLGLHSMVHYRSRAAALCWRALSLQAQAAAVGSDGEDEPPIALSRSLAPAMAVQQAVARLPVLPPVGNAAQQEQQQQAQRQQLKQAAVHVTVAVHGTGLESCTGAILRLPGTDARTALAPSAVSNLARQQLLQDLPAAAGSHGSKSSAKGAAGLLHAAAAGAGRLWHAVARHPPEQQEQQHQHERMNDRPGLVLQFPVPPGALRQLALEQQGLLSELPAARLVLLSDFERVSAAVQLLPTAVWVLGLDGPVAAATWQQLQAAWAPASPAEQQQQWWRRRPALPGRAAVPLRGLWRGGSGTVHVGPADRAPPSEAQQEQQEQQGPQHQPQHAQHQPQQQQEQHQPQHHPQPSHFKQQASARLASLRQQLSAHVHWESAGKEQAAPPAALLGGMLLADATLALAGDASSSSSHAGRTSLASRLELAADSLRWSAAERQRAAAAAGGQHAPEQLAGGVQGDEEPEVYEPEDEDLADLSSLGLAAQLRRQLARAGGMAGRRAAALRHRRQHAALLLRALPPPDALLLVLHHRQLQASAFGEGLDGGVLAAIHRLAAACRSSAPQGVPLLLAVASPTPLSSPYRRQLAYACGLAAEGSGPLAGGSSRRGCVVPLLLAATQQAGEVGRSSGWEAAAAGRQQSAPASPRVGPLAAALQAYAAAAVADWERRQQAEQRSRL